MVKLNYRDTRPIYIQIMDDLRRQIRAGILENGEKLPSVRELACRLAINPNTIARAYRELEMAGWIATVPGKGCFVCGIPGEATQEQQRLLAQFDQVAAALIAAGIDARTLAQRLQQGGDQNA